MTLAPLCWVGVVVQACSVLAPGHQSLKQKSETYDIYLLPPNEVGLQGQLWSGAVLWSCVCS